MSCSKSFKICFYGTVLKQFFKLHCHNNFLKEHRSKGYEHLTLFIDLGTSPWDTSIQGTPPFTEHQIRFRKNVHIIFVSITLVLKRHLFSGERDSFSGLGNPGLTSIQGTPWHWKSDWPKRGLISLNKCTLLTVMKAFTSWTISFEWMLPLLVNY